MPTCVDTDINISRDRKQQLTTVLCERSLAWNGTTNDEKKTSATFIVFVAWYIGVQMRLYHTYVSLFFLCLCNITWRDVQRKPRRTARSNRPSEKNCSLCFILKGHCLRLKIKIPLIIVYIVHLLSLILQCSWYSLIFVYYNDTTNTFKSIL